MCCKRLSSPRCRSELIDSAWVVIVPGQKYIKKQQKKHTQAHSHMLAWTHTPGLKPAHFSKGAKNLLTVSSSEHVQEQNFEGCMSSCVCVVDVCVCRCVGRGMPLVHCHKLYFGVLMKRYQKRNINVKRLISETKQTWHIRNPKYSTTNI